MKFYKLQKHLSTKCTFVVKLRKDDLKQVFKNKFNCYGYIAKSGIYVSKSTKTMHKTFNKNI